MNITEGRINYALEDGRNDLHSLECKCQEFSVNEKIKAIKKTCGITSHTELFMLALEVLRIVSEYRAEGGNAIFSKIKHQ